MSPLHLCWTQFLVWSQLLLLAAAPAPALVGRRHVDLKWVGRLHPFSTLHAAVEAAGALAPGRHYIGRRLELNRRRHDNVSFLGRGTVAPAPGTSISSGRDIPTVVPPHNGGLKPSVCWAVVGPACVLHCAGCTQVWRVPIPKGVDSRLFYVNCVRANRT